MRDALYARIARRRREQGLPVDNLPGFARRTAEGGCPYITLPAGCRRYVKSEPEWAGVRIG